MTPTHSAQARRPTLRPRDESGVRIVPPSLLEDHVTAELVAFLLECARGAVFVLDGRNELLATNDAGCELLDRAGCELLRLVEESCQTMVETPIGRLRVNRRHLSTTGTAQHIVLLAEPFADDTSETLRMAATLWQPTSRQAMVLRHVLEGLANKEIAVLLGMSPRTVEVHVTALLQKAGVDSRSRLIAKARALHDLRSSRFMR
ncbi:MAG: response regulator transcription factor [Labilithrix sp.]|nr:response regulator transcription factor [Labilithrix sp.]MCW5817343.1 response regulator transcription factor [Labilithrix sp.]